MLSDRFSFLGMGHRKPYILLGLVTQAVCLLIVPFVDPAKYYWGFVALAFVIQTGMALYDTCTDGLALDTTPEEEQGVIQGFMVGGRAVGVVLTAAVVGLLAEYVSWTAVFWLLAALSIIPIPLVLGVKEGERTISKKFDWGAFRSFRQKSVIFLALLGFVFFFVIAGANVLVNPFLESEFGISLSMAGYYTTVWGLGVVGGGILGGRLYGWIGREKITWLSILGGFVGIGMLALTNGPNLAWVLVAIFGLAYGLQNTVYFALAMKYTDPRIAASMFSILMAVTNVAQGVGMALSGVLSDRVGFRVAFGILAAINLLAIPLISLVFVRQVPGQQPDYQRS
jgi:PAT family beta-lactamase induction signal transducer AmpG